MEQSMILRSIIVNSFYKHVSHDPRGYTFPLQPYTKRDGLYVKSDNTKQQSTSPPPPLPDNNNDPLNHYKYYLHHLYPYYYRITSNDDKDGYSGKHIPDSMELRDHPMHNPALLKLFEYNGVDIPKPEIDDMFFLRLYCDSVEDLDKISYRKTSDDNRDEEEYDPTAFQETMGDSNHEHPRAEEKSTMSSHQAPPDIEMIEHLLQSSAKIKSLLSKTFPLLHEGFCMDDLKYFDISQREKKKNHDQPIHRIPKPQPKYLTDDILIVQRLESAGSKRQIYEVDILCPIHYQDAIAKQLENIPGHNFKQTLDGRIIFTRCIMKMTLLDVPSNKIRSSKDQQQQQQQKEKKASKKKQNVDCIQFETLEDQFRALPGRRVFAQHNTIKNRFFEQQEKRQGRKHHATQQQQHKPIKEPIDYHRNCYFYPHQGNTNPVIVPPSIYTQQRQQQDNPFYRDRVFSKSKTSTSEDEDDGDVVDDDDELLIPPYNDDFETIPIDSDSEGNVPGQSKVIHMSGQRDSRKKKRYGDKPHYFLRTNKAWDEVLGWSQLLPQYFYGNFTLYDSKEHKWWSVLFIPKFRSTVQELLNKIIQNAYDFESEFRDQYVKIDRSVSANSLYSRNASKSSVRKGTFDTLVNNSSSSSGGGGGGDEQKKKISLFGSLGRNKKSKRNTTSGTLGRTSFGNSMYTAASISTPIDTNDQQNRNNRIVQQSSQSIRTCTSKTYTVKQMMEKLQTVDKDPLSSDIDERIKKQLFKCNISASKSREFSPMLRLNYDADHNVIHHTDNPPSNNYFRSKITSGSGGGDTSTISNKRLGSMSKSGGYNASLEEIRTARNHNHFQETKSLPLDPRVTIMIQERPSWTDILFDYMAQILLYTLTPFKRENFLCHNDFKIDNIAYVETERRYCFVKFTRPITTTTTTTTTQDKNELSSSSHQQQQQYTREWKTTTLRIPTYGRLFVPIDFGWSNFTLQIPQRLSFLREPGVNVYGPKNSGQNVLFDDSDDDNDNINTVSASYNVRRERHQNQQNVNRDMYHMPYVKDIIRDERPIAVSSSTPENVGMKLDNAFTDIKQLAYSMLFMIRYTGRLRFRFLTPEQWSNLLHLLGCLGDSDLKDNVMTSFKDSKSWHITQYVFSSWCCTQLKQFQNDEDIFNLFQDNYIYDKPIPAEDIPFIVEYSPFYGQTKHLSLSE